MITADWKQNTDCLLGIKLCEACRQRQLEKDLDQAQIYLYESLYVLGESVARINNARAYEED